LLEPIDADPFRFSDEVYKLMTTILSAETLLGSLLFEQASYNQDGWDVRNLLSGGFHPGVQIGTEWDTG